MNQDMSTLFPDGIRALVVDDDAKFLTSACMMLSILDFKVTTCASPTTALNLLSREKIKDVNVVLANAAKIAACGFDFRGIVESDLFIPVVYFLPLDHKATGDEADELLRTLQAATYIINKPLDAGQVCDLWKDIAWRMCFLEAKANQAGRNRVVPAAGGEAGGSAMAEEREDEERIHFKVVKTGGGSRKRKSTAAGNPGGSSGTSLAGDDPAKNQKQKNVTEGQETANVANQQQERRSIKAKKDDGKAAELEEPDGMEDQQPGMFADTAMHSNNNVAAGNTTTSPSPPPALLPPVNPAPCPVHSAAMPALALHPAPALCPVHSAPEPSLPAPVTVPEPSRVYPAPALQHTAHNVFDTTTPMQAVTTMAVTITSTPQFSQQQQQDMFEPWSQGCSWMQQHRGTGPVMLSFQRPPTGDLFTGMASGGVTFGASAPATADAGASYGNEASSLIQSLNLGTDDHDKLNPPLAPQNAVPAVASNEAAMAMLYNDNYCARALMAPHHIGRGVAAHEAASSGGYIDYSAVLAMARQQQQVGHGVGVAQEEAAGGMEEATNSNSFSNPSSGSSSHLAFNTEDYFSNYSAASHSHMAAPDQVVGNDIMASNVNELTMAGGAFGSSSNVGNQEMFPDDQYEENTMFTLEDLLGHDGQQDGATDGAAADGAEASLIGGEGDEEILDNNMFTVEDLLGLDDQQGGATGGAAAADAGETSLIIGGEGNEVIWDNNMFTVEDLLGLDDHQGGTTGGAVTAADAAGTSSLIGGEEGEGTWDIGAADNLDDFFVGVGDLWNFNMPSYDANNGRE